MQRHYCATIERTELLQMDYFSLLKCSRSFYNRRQRRCLWRLGIFITLITLSTSGNSSLHNRKRSPVPLNEVLRTPSHIHPYPLTRKQYSIMLFTLAMPDYLPSIYWGPQTLFTDLGRQYIPNLRELGLSPLVVLLLSWKCTYL
jgi:hypothetical protein